MNGGKVSFRDIMPYVDSAKRYANPEFGLESIEEETKTLNCELKDRVTDLVENIPA